MAEQENDVVVEPKEAAPEPSAETKNTEEKEHMIPKSRLDEVLTANKELLAKVSAQETAQQEAEDAVLVEQGKFKELYEKAQVDAQAASDKLLQLELNSIKHSVAAEAGYPALWDRLTGDDEDSLKVDMDSLTASLPTPTAPPIDGGTGSGQRAISNSGGPQKRSDAYRKQYASTIGVLEEHLPEEI